MLKISALRILVLVSTVTGVPAGVFAQETGTTASVVEVHRQLVVQEQLVRDLLKRLDSLEAGNAALLQRLATLETAQNAEAVIAAGDAVPPNGAEAPQPVHAAVASVEEKTTGLEDRMDALPKVSGYYDFEFFKEGSPGAFGEFRQHHLSVHISKEYRKYRMLSELEFEYAARVEIGGQSRGYVKVEQTWAEYVASDAFTLRAGFMLTPNYWNVNHYPSTTASTRRPLMVRNVYPESFVGVMGYGTKYWGGLGVGYNAYVGNGEGVGFGQHDDNNAKAAGGALKFDLPVRGFDTFRFDVTGYADTSAPGRRTRTWGLESQVRRGPAELLFEFARRRAAENRSGVYLQPGYRLIDQFLAFYRYDRLVAANGVTQANTWGVNLRPIPPVSLKFELFRTRVPGARRFNGIASSVAVAF